MVAGKVRVGIVKDKVLAIAKDEIQQFNIDMRRIGQLD